MGLAAGVEPPAPDHLQDAGIVHAVDGDGTALCSESTTVEAIDSKAWGDVPRAQRCPACDFIMQAAVNASAD